MATPLDGDGTAATERTRNVQASNMRPELLLARTLLHSDGPGFIEEDGHDHEEHVLGEGEGEEEHSHLSETQTLRIVGLFVVLAAGLLGSVPPLFIKAFNSPSHPVPILLRALTAGIILALACIHIIPEAVEGLDSLTRLMSDKYPYNPAGACIVFGAVIMVSMEALAHHWVSRNTHSQRPVAEAAEAAAAPVGPPGDPHTHVCMGQAHLALLASPKEATPRDKIMAVMFELGCLFHSVFIGLTLGVMTDDKSAVTSLVIALCFHQALEGLALGSFITRARLGLFKEILMVVAYSLTCPLGVAIGLGVSTTYDAESVTNVAVQGVFNGVSGGMLLYISLVQLIAEDFSRRDLAPVPYSPHGDKEDLGKDDLPEPGMLHMGGAALRTVEQPTWLQLSAHGCLYLGAVCMAILALWA